MDDHAAFLRLYLSHQNELRAFVAACLRRPADSDEVLQDVAVALWQGFSRFDPARPFLPWARGVAAIEMHRFRRERGRLHPTLSPQAIAALEVAFADDEPVGTLEALRRCRDALPGHALRLVELRYHDNHDLERIATMTGRSVEAVGKALQRVRSALAACVQRELQA